MSGREGTSVAESYERRLANGSTCPQTGSVDTHLLNPEAIAIVGIAAEFPGAEDTEALWRVLQEGLNTVEQIPPTRFKVSAHTHPRHSDTASRRMNVTMGNFIDHADMFDNTFFEISPREARSMDPQQRVLLRLAHRALENAGYSPAATPTFDPDTFATFIGAATNDYVQNLRTNVDVYYSTAGTLPAFLSGRLSYVFGFGGPSMVLDTACSSSIVAIHQACRALISGDCNAALAGGVNIITSPDMYLGLARGHFLSDTGQCRPWDASADGYCRSEGCGLFVLKRLDDAIAEGDRILAVIRGIELNQSGNASSITHPHVDAQAALFKKLVSSAGLDPRDISVAECHGTGTQAGDPAELEAVRKVLAVGRDDTNPLYITSIKANIGHAEAASGAASLAKLILMMRHQSIPRHISFEKLNPRIPDLSIDNIRINTVEIPWVCPDNRRRIAILANFGAAGSNSALILEEHGMPPRPAPVAGELLVGLSCRSLAALEQRRKAYLTELERVQDEATLQDFAYSATARRQTYPYRIAIMGSSKEELIADLGVAKAVEAGPCDKVIFVFSGQGSQYVGMGSELYKRFPGFAHVVDECHHELLELGSPGVLDLFQGVVFPSGPGESARFASHQAALFVVEYALAQVWISWGVRPHAVVGHSFGEFAALAVAGCLTLPDALRLVIRRAEAISASSIAEPTGMTSVRASADAIASSIGVGRFSHLEVCCYNSESNFVVGGPLDELKCFEKRLDTRGVHHSRLVVPYAYHSAAMDSALPALYALSRDIKLSAPTIPVLSNVTGTLIHPGDASAFDESYFARHCRKPARFQQGMADLAAQIDLSSVAACIEMGPHPVTLPLLRGFQVAETPLLLPSLRKGLPDLQTMCAALAKLYCTSVPVRWRKVFNDLTPGARLVDLPAYPFAQTRFWVPYEERCLPEERDSHVRLERRNVHVRRDSAVVEVYETDLSSFATLIQGHLVVGSPLCPASIYVELVLSAVTSACEAHLHMDKDDDLDLEDVFYPAPLVYIPGRPHNLQVEITLCESIDRAGSFTVSRTAEGDAVQEVHCKGSFKLTPVETRSSKFSSIEAMVKREAQGVLQPTSASAPETFNTRTVYDLLFPAIVIYSDIYRVIENITVSAPSSKAYAIIQLPKTATSGPFVAHPIFVDALFHVSGFLVNFLYGLRGADAYICSRFEKAQLLQHGLDVKARYGVYAAVTRVQEGAIAVDVYAVEVDDPRQRVVTRLKRVWFRRVAMDSFAKALQAAAAGHNAVTPRDDCVPPTPSEYSTSTPRTQTFEEAKGDLARDVMRIIAETAGIPEDHLRVGRDPLLSHLGIDSLMLWEIAARLNTSPPERPLKLDARTLSSAKTVGRLVELVLEKYRRDHPSGHAREAVEDGDLTLCADEPEELKPCVPQSAEKALIAGTVIDPPGASGHDLCPLRDDVLVGFTGEVRLQTFALDAAGVIREGTPVQINPLPEPDGCTPLQTEPPPVDYAAPPCLHERVPSVCGAELVRLQRAPAGSPRKPPLFLIHDGSGTVSSYESLASLGCDVWAFRNHDFSKLFECEDALGMELQAMAVSYMMTLIEEFKYFKESRRCFEGECLIGGWSFGGVVAYELARQLIAIGVCVKGLILIDAPAPQTRSPLPDWLITAVATRLAGTQRDDCEKFDATCATASDHIGRAGRADAAGWFVQQMKTATSALVGYERGRAPRLRAVYLRAREGTGLVHDRGGEQELDGRVRAFLAKERDRWTMPLWEEALGGETMAIWDVPGDHFTMFSGENVEELSKRLREGLERLLASELDRAVERALEDFRQDGRVVRARAFLQDFMVTRV
ncbi:ketoacyl-synt-domain-containing protein [Pilatotrama ljubarskyi]|nr:ketoacyl-synt-domain-containing protein [Pilatotrama ljubarskyi]